MTTATSITVRVPLAIRHRPGRKTVVTPMADDVAPIITRADPTLVKALARAFRYQRLLDQGQYENIIEMASAEKLDRGYMGRLLQLTLLSPAIVEGLLAGTSPKPPQGLLTLANSPQCWIEQSAWIREMETSHCGPAAAPSKARY